jgi:hypothetical protein
MIDPVTIGAAFALAKTSVGFVKEAINMGREIRDCGKELSDFFKSQGEIEKAANEVDDPQQAQVQESALSQAFTIVSRRRELKQFETELRDMFAMKGELDFYRELCEERQKIVNSQDDAAREKIRKDRLAKDRAARKKQEMEELLMTAGIIVFLVIGGIIIFVAIYNMG